MFAIRHLVIRSVRHNWRINLSVALAVAAASAVLTGAFIVGDSMRGSLRDLILSRLGNIDHIVMANRFFRADLADELAANSQFAEQYSGAYPAFLLQVTMQRQTNPNDVHSGRANGVLIWGLTETYEHLGDGGPTSLPEHNEIVLNEPLATELGVSVGDQVIARLPKLNQIPSDSPFGHKVDTIRSVAGLTVKEIIPAQGLARFGLNPTQHLPLNAFVHMATIGKGLDQKGKANAILVTSTRTKNDADDATSTKHLQTWLRPTLKDYGFRIEHVRQPYRPQSGTEEIVGFEYVQITSDRMLITPAVDRVLTSLLAPLNAQTALTYLANTIRHVGSTSPASPESADLQDKNENNNATEIRREIPYSTITAIDSKLPLGPIVSANGEPITDLASDEIVLNRWTAAQLGVTVGERVELVYFAPETTHGKFEETSASFKVREIVEVTRPTRPFRADDSAVFHHPPTLANDPHLTPEVEGFTDRDSIADWDPPFPFDQSRVQPADDDYWDYFRGTPKAFVSRTTGKELWGTERFGTTTAYRIPLDKFRQTKTDSARPSDEVVHAFANEVLEAIRAADLHPGMQFLAVRRQGLQAATGTTSFSGLFLGFSFFLIAAALMLVVLLFRLGMGQRAREIGLLFALGWNQRQVTLLLTSESLLVALAGTVMGIIAGVTYAWLMLVGLHTLWLDAVVTPFLELHVSVNSLWMGGLTSMMAAVLSMTWSLRGFSRQPVRGMLAGQPEPDPIMGTEPTAISKYGWLILIFLAVALIGLGATLSGEAQAGCFFGCGACVLTACLIGYSRRFRSVAKISHTRTGWTLISLASSNTSRRPGRSALTIGLVACAVFLIGAISCFHLEPSLQGTGGFALVGTSDQSIHADLNTSQGRLEAGLIGDTAVQLLEDSTTVAFALNAGDDASCLNLFQPKRPSILGVPPLLGQLAMNADSGASGFRWAESMAETDAELQNPWLLLEREFEDRAVPVVLDKNTAMYSMHLFMMSGAGTTFTLDHEDGRQITYRIVGLLSNSILQGKLMISAKTFQQQFPDIGGFHFFLTQVNDANQEHVEALSRLLENKLSDQGLDMQPAPLVLQNLLAVQNTYLSTFQSLGALGLLLGTVGLATVQLRNVLERNGELAVMRASGFRDTRLISLVLFENTNLMLLGWLAGVAAAAMAVLPHWLLGGASIPWTDLITLLGVVLLAGLAGGLLAVRAVIQTPLLTALRNE